MKNKKLYTLIDSKQIINLNRAWKLDHNKLAKRLVSVAIIGEGQAVGDDEISQQQPTRHHKAVVKSDHAEVWALETMVCHNIIFNSYRNLSKTPPILIYTTNFSKRTQ